MFSSWTLIALMALAQISVACLGVSIYWIVRRVGAARKQIARIESILDVLDVGVLVCNGLHIVAANRSFSQLIEMDAERVQGLLLSEILPDSQVVEQLVEDKMIDLETELTSSSGARIEVEISARTIAHAGELGRLIEIHDIRDRKASQQKIKFLAHHDPLTRLPNREVLRIRLDRMVAEAKKSDHKCALIWIDLDNFKPVNDTYGHRTGDALLCSVAKILREELPSEYLATRFGGDEFVVLSGAIPDVLEARLVTQQLCRRLNADMMIDGRMIPVSASIGLAVYPDDADDAQELLRNADLAMYEAKASGRRNYQRFAGRLRDDFNRRKVLKGQIEEAMEDGSIEPFFQPIVSSRTGRIRSFEALIRWKHPEFNFVPPPEIIRVAEERGLLGPLTDLVISRAMQTAKDWPDDIRFAVNVTPSQINATFVDRIRGLLKQHDFNPKRLELEVTEDALISDFDHITSMFSRLRSIGMPVAMDDFGAGYTSIGNLRRLNFDRIKIDRVLTMNLPDHRRSAAIVRSLILMAQELDVAVTVEGIETEEQLDFLREFDCSIQGFLFSPPVPASGVPELKRMLDNSSQSDRQKKNSNEHVRSNLKLIA